MVHNYSNMDASSKVFETKLTRQSKKVPFSKFNGQMCFAGRNITNLTMTTKGEKKVAKVHTCSK